MYICCVYVHLLSHKIFLIHWLLLVNSCFFPSQPIFSSTNCIVEQESSSILWSLLGNIHTQLLHLPPHLTTAITITQRIIQNQGVVRVCSMVVFVPGQSNSPLILLPVKSGPDTTTSAMCCQISDDIFLQFSFFFLIHIADP